MTAMVASLGMYDHPAQRAANDALWTALSRRLLAAGVDAPAALDRTRPVEAIWRDPNLLLAQACGFPLANDPGLALRVIAVPTYAVPGCGRGRHRSLLVVREEELGPLAAFAGRRAAINAPQSNSGSALLYAAIAYAGGEARFAAVIETGSHHASALAVRDGRADIAAIDAVTSAALRRFEPAAVAGLRIVAASPSSPALPFVTAAATSARTLVQLRTALAAAFDDPALTEARAALFLRAVAPATARRYASLRRDGRMTAPPITDRHRVPA